MQKTQDNIIKFNQILLIILLFVPLLTSNTFMYPYVYFKAIIFRTIVSILGLSTIFLFFKNRLPKVESNKYIWFFVIFLASLPLISFVGVNPIESWWGGFERMEGGFYYLYLAVAFLAYILYFSYKDVWQKVFWALLSSNFLLSIIAILQKFDLSIVEYQGRIGGTLGNAAYLASTLVLGSVLLIFFFEKYKKYRWYSAAAIVLNFIAIFISATRGALLALFVSGFLAGIFILLKKNLLQKKIKIGLASVLALVVLVVGGIFVFKDSPLVKNTETLRRVSEISLQETTAASRIKVWEYSYQGFLDKPIVGWGLENFDVMFNKYYDGSIGEEWFDRAHNNYLDILISGGVVALLLYLTFIFFVYKKIFSLYKQEKISYFSLMIFAFGFLAYLIQNIFIFDTVSNLIFLFVFLALLYYLGQDKDELLYLKLKKILKKISWVLGSIVIIVSVWFLILSPSVASISAKQGFDNIYLQNDAKAEELLNKAIDYTPQKFGDEEVLLFLSSLIEDELAFNKAVNLDWTVDLIERSNTEHIKIISKLANFYNFKGIIDKDPSYYDKSLELMNSVIDDNPGKRELYTQMGRSYILKGEVDTGQEYFKKALDIRLDKNSLWNLITVYVYAQDADKVVEYADELMDKGYYLTAPEIRRLIPSYEEKKINDKLEYFLAQLLELEDEEDPEVLSDMAIVKLRLNKSNEAIEYAKRALEADPEQGEKLAPLFNF